MPASFRSEKREHFVVKIQGSLAKDEKFKCQKLDENAPLLVKNKAGSLVGNLEKTENPSIHAELVAVLKEKGWKGIVGFFHAFYLPGPAEPCPRGTMTENLVELYINPKNVLPMNSW